MPKSTLRMLNLTRILYYGTYFIKLARKAPEPLKPKRSYELHLRMALDG